MARYIKNARKKAGLPPGSVVYVGDKPKQPRITFIEYSAEGFTEREIQNFDEGISSRVNGTICWLNVDGLDNTEILNRIGEKFSVHPLVLEDIAHTAQRPKYEEFDEYIFIVVRMLRFDNNNLAIDSEQVSFLLGKGWLVSFQEKEGDVFDAIRERIRTGKGRIRREGADYLAYLLIDAIVDNYFIVLEQVGQLMEDIEDSLVGDIDSSILNNIRVLKRELIFLRKSVWPLREVVSGLLHMEVGLIQKTTRIYLRDLYDHTIQVIETTESYRDMINSLVDIYMSSMSNKMNEIMKLLTIISTIFIPITFIAGIYGMNFDPDISAFNMPELRWKFGYLFAISLMLTIVVLMLMYFRKKRWL